MITAAVFLATWLPMTGCGDNQPAADAIESGSNESLESNGSFESSRATDPSGPSQQDALPSSPPAGDQVSDQATDPSLLYDQATAALDAGDTDSAFKLIRQARSAAPGNPDITFLMAYVLAERNRFEQAIKMLDDLAAELPEARLPVYGQTAEWLVLAGDWDQAETRFRAILNDAPEASMAQRALAQLLLRSGRRTEAAELLRQLCRRGVVELSNSASLLRVAFPLEQQLASEDFEPIGAFGEARFHMGKGQWQEAARVLAEATKPSPAITALTGRLLAHQGDQPALRDWVAANPDPIADSADYWFALSVHHQQLDQHPAAIRSLSKVLLRDATDATAYAMLSRSLDALGRSAESAEAFKRSRWIAKTHQLANQILADAQPRSEDIDALADLTARLQRPFESFAWQTVAVSVRQSRGEITATQAKQQIGAINSARLAETDSGSGTATESFILCGVDPQTVAP